jgi:DNA-directed RNA polymerase specialized sigma24 family protein
MDAPQWKGRQHLSEAYPEDWIHISHRAIVRACLSAGLSSADAEDLAQDVWEWVIRNGIPMSLIATPWLNGAVHNYIRRFRRRSFWHRRREGRPLESTGEPQCRPLLPVLESNDLLDRLAGVLPRRERRLLHLVRRGYSIAEASRALGIPRGSCAYHQDRLVAYARRTMEWKTGPLARAAGSRSSVEHPRRGH